MATKKEFKFFTITDFDRQAAYLTAMHRQGWQLTKIVAGVFYHFEKVAPADVVYQLDFKETHADKDSYLQLYSDYGWECVVSNTQMMIFRKPAQADDDLTIFSDKESNVKMQYSLIANQLFYLVLSYLTALGVITLSSSMSRLTVIICFIFIHIIFVPIFLNLTYGFYHLKKKLG